jgi:hypothetical protein
MRRRIKGGQEFGSLAHIGGFALDAATGGEDGARAILVAEGTKRLCTCPVNWPRLATGGERRMSAANGTFGGLLAERETLSVQAIWEGAMLRVIMQPAQPLTMRPSWLRAPNSRSATRAMPHGTMRHLRNSPT